MQRLLFPLLCFLLLLACEGGTKSRKAARGEHYVPDPNYIYFKNIRWRNYRANDRGEAGNYLTHEDLFDSGAKLIPVIHDNWMEDQAILELHTRTGAGSASPAGQIELLITSPTGEQTVRLPPKLSIAEVKQFDSHLEKNRLIRLVIQQDTLAAFPDESNRFAREVLADYLRLVESER